MPKGSINILNDELQGNIFRKVAENLFLDIDRPFRTLAELKERIEASKQWEVYKLNLRKSKSKSKSLEKSIKAFFAC